MEWILGIAATAMLLMIGGAVLACVAVYRVGSRSKRKGADHDQTDQKRGTPKDA